MENLNYVLFDEFTKLNKTCITVYQLEEGILMLKVALEQTGE